MAEDTRLKIISAAMELFTACGYEKTKIEDISKKAGVTRMMVYYYFDSKEEILKTIIKNLFDEAIKKIEKEEIDFLNPSNFITRVGEIVGDKKEFLGFVIGEVLKNKLEDFPILTYLKEFYNKIIEIFSKKFRIDLKKRDLDILYVNFLFFNSLPLLSFFLLKEKVAKELNIDEKKIEKLFIEKFLASLKETVEKLRK